MRTADYSKSALLVIDAQRYFFDRTGGAFITETPQILPNIVSLIESFRLAHLPVIFTRHAHKKGEPTGQMGRWWDGDLPFEGTRYCQFTSRIEPISGESTITKTRYSAFEGTSLETQLKKHGSTDIVICGVMTNVCVETTARHAFIRDFQPIVVKDACAGKTPEHHEASILNLSYAFAIVEKTSGVIKGLGAK